NSGDGNDRVLINNSYIDASEININLGHGDDFLGISNSEVTAGMVAFDGSIGVDTLLFGQTIGTDTLWQIDGQNTGIVEGLAFNNFENLTGGADNSDVFIIGANGDIDGTIHGGMDGRIDVNDHLVIDQHDIAPTDFVHTLSGAQGGALTSSDGQTDYSYAGIEQVDVGSQTGTNTITLTNDANMTLTQNIDGTLVGMIQHAFDADTDLNTLTGGDGFVLTGTDDSVGQTISAAGDVNADGIDDVIIGDPGKGLAYVLFGTEQGFNASLDLSNLDGSNGFVLTGPSGQNFAYAVGGGGDVIGDGIDDLIIGAPGATGNFSAGVSYVIFGTENGFAANVDVSILDGTNGFTIQGLADGDASGFSVAIVDDINGDFISDVLIGAPGADPDATLVDAGQAYLVFGT
ncbi:MAG: hypothetical protein GY943_35905, partial [Chloroflexi bacterium]|nr:hypothetical protein [Chloroflexota bacterium]